MHVHYHPGLVMASITIAIFCSSVALFLLSGFERLSGKAKRLRIAAAGLAFATGTWSMHFIGMLACTLPVALAYDPLITVYSYLFAVIGAIPAMLIISKKRHTRLHQFEATLCLTIAICVMHYSGMASLRMNPPIKYEPFWFSASIMVAFVVSYIGLQVTERWQQASTVTQKSYLPLLLTGTVLGLAVSSMHYTAMAAAHFYPDSVSLAALSNGIQGDNLFYAALCSNVLLMLLLLFVLLSDNKVVLWKVLLIVGLSESTIMLVMPIMTPDSLSNSWKTVFDVGSLLLFVLPVAWRLKITTEALLINTQALELNLDAQQATNELLLLPIHQLDMEELLNKALKIVLQISWLKIAPNKGAIFLNNAEEKKLRMVAQHNLSPEVADACFEVKHGHCLCGQAATELAVQYHTHLDAAHSIQYGTMTDHGHYVMPLLSNQQLLGVLCLYLDSGYELHSREINILKNLGTTLAKLIRFKQAQEEISLADTVFKHNLSCLLVTNADKKILRVNPVFCEVTGYSMDEVIGKTPSILSSGHHDGNFYHNIWQTLAETGRWTGEIWNKRKNGEFYLEWLTITAIHDYKGNIKNYIGVFDDISLRKAHEERIKQLAFFDALTGLANRTLFYDTLELAMARAKKQHTKVALLFIDLDHFKEVNDTLGHDAGDELLKTVAQRISTCLRASDTLARLGGDEFVVILHDMQQTPTSNPAQVCEKIAQNIINRLSESHCYKDFTFYGGASIGIVIYPDDAHSISDLIQLADTAMYEAKNGGRNSYRFFSSEMIDSVKKRVTMIHQLKQAIEKSELYLVFQPLIQVESQAIIGAEVLLRWESSELGVVSPLEFIPLAEETGLILTIGAWVIEQACQQLNAWNHSQTVKLDYLAVNISIHQLTQPDFIDTLVTICRKNGISSDKLELEITEGGLAQCPDNICETLNKLNSLGYKLAIDDFGTDYSSLSRLKLFNVDLLKIDRSFVRGMTFDKDDAAIVRAVIDLAKALELTTLAEGVELIEQFELLQEYGCQRVQGYLFGKPMTASKFAEFFATRHVAQQARISNAVATSLDKNDLCRTPII